MELETKDYSIWFDAETATVFFQGFLRLDGTKAYQPIMDWLISQMETVSKITLDFQELEFLNSSGVSMLSMFVVQVRNRGNIQMALRGSNKILWQTRSLRNLQRLMPSIQLELI